MVLYFYVFFLQGTSLFFFLQLEHQKAFLAILKTISKNKITTKAGKKKPVKIMTPNRP